MDRGYIYVNKNNFRHNINYLNNLTGSELCIVVKANAYGHGIDWTVNTAIAVSYTHLTLPTKA